MPAFFSASWSIVAVACSAVSTGIDTPPGMTAFSVRPCAHAARVLEDDLPQRRAERQLVDAGRLTWPLTPKIVLPVLFAVPIALEPVRAASR